MSGNGYEFKEGDVMALSGNGTSVFWWCEGCEQMHTVPVQGPRPWGFNKSLSKPTLSPSVLMTWKQGEEQTEKCCHLFIRDGNVEFCPDSLHHLAGKTLPLTVPSFLR